MKEQWKEDPSCKIDCIIEITIYHLEENNWPLLKAEADKLVFLDPDIQSEKVTAKPDNIVIYCSFSSAFVQISQMSLDDLFFLFSFELCFY